jgi:hypothetical protein
LAYWLYSCESLPNPAMMGKPGYTPDQEFIRWNGITLPLLHKGVWTKLPDSMFTIRRSDWKDRQGQEVEVHISRFKGIISSRFAARGVIFMDHEPSAAEKEKLEKVSQDLNYEFRKDCIQTYEDQVAEKQVTGHGRTKPTPYEDECYEILKMPKPYSVDTFRAQRQPGQEAGERIAAAIAEANKPMMAVVEALTEALTKNNTKPASK